MFEQDSVQSNRWLHEERHTRVVMTFKIIFIISFTSFGMNLNIIIKEF